MNYQEFRCEFLERMKEVMEEGVNITTEQINKNNGIVMEGVMLRKENARVASVFYLEDYFKYWEREPAPAAWYSVLPVSIPQMTVPTGTASQNSTAPLLP